VDCEEVFLMVLYAGQLPDFAVAMWQKMKLQGLGEG
jgi:hypothetical protein